MIDPKKISEIDGKKSHNASLEKEADHGDAHAMKALLGNELSKKSIGLSSLFSSQTRQVLSNLGTTGTDGEGAEGMDKKKERRLEGNDREGHDNDRDGEKSGHPLSCHPIEKESNRELTDEVAEQILVSDPRYLEPGKEHEVRIKIKDAVLKDATVHLIREPDCLRVKLISSDVDTIQRLTATREGLEKQLSKHYDGWIDISIHHQRIK